MKNPKIAFYGGSFDPPHVGHMAIAEAVLEQFELDEFVFLPAFHAPHKKRVDPTPAIDRYAMLCLATQNEALMSVSRLEIEAPGQPYTYETLSRLTEILPRTDIYFVMGADSWMDITTWREWQLVLSLSHHIVVTRPGHEISTDHVNDEVRSRIVDLREHSKIPIIVDDDVEPESDYRIYFTDQVNIDISATEIRLAIRSGEADLDRYVPSAVANYIEKYQIYK